MMLAEDIQTSKQRAWDACVLGLVIYVWVQQDGGRPITAGEEAVVLRCQRSLNELAILDRLARAMDQAGTSRPAGAEVALAGVPAAPAGLHSPAGVPSKAPP